MAIKSSKGQAFTVFAVVFSSLMILTALALTSDFHGEPLSMHSFYDNALTQTPTVFNQALSEEKSADRAMKDLYTYNSFVERRSLIRDLDYQSINLFVLPERGEIGVINYQDSSEDLSVDINGDTISYSLGPKNRTMETFEPGEAEVTVDITERDISRDFNVSTPRVFVFMEMRSGEERWVNHILR